MSISDSLSQQRLLKILVHVYQKGNTVENIGTKEVIEEIKHQILQCDYQKSGAVRIEKIV